MGSLKASRNELWLVRYLSAKLAAKAEALVSQQLVSKEVSKEQLETDQATIDNNARSIADKVINQRHDLNANAIGMARPARQAIRRCLPTALKHWPAATRRNHRRAFLNQFVTTSPIRSDSTHLAR